MRWIPTKLLKHSFFLAVLLNSLPLFAQDLANPFVAQNEPDARVTYHNPVIPGFYSDPSVCRVGNDYYLITSTFEYYPGVPVFHSNDLVNWEQIGHCIHRKEQLKKSLNIFAATIRYHEGTFYMITTSFGEPRGNFYVTATNPAGPWSDPVFIEVGGIDPDLFWDEDGRSYIISSEFKLYEIDLKTGKILNEGKKVWHGTGGRYPEGPHIYKKDGYYYLMASEGGTEEAHHVTIARSNSIWGPYITNPANPILAHANAAAQGNPIQGVGHADMVQAHDGSFWLLFHGYRSISYPVHHLLGRETCLAPVTWPKNGWPVVNGNGTATEKMTCPTLPLQTKAEKPSKINFDTETLDLEWNYIQLPNSTNYSLTERPGYLRLKGDAQIISTQHSSTFIGKRLTDLNFTVSTQLEFNPNSTNEEAGIVLLNNGTHFNLMVSGEAEQRYLQVQLKFGSITYKSEKTALKPGPVKLRIKGETSTYAFLYAQGDNDYREIEKVDSRYLSTETVGGFTGVYFGLYATGNGKVATAKADYDWVEYIGD
ncbi:glycoside hydrolase family 43 protein [uncultured Draconibacterium sp.]|uniref:glycoside hydrolase family 43 protein n=1 Tax=uncultured Draconibacterium sp. TaxID=1573823 RepID=UPI0025EA2D04|nr:glycoside hydrolase family 43 protein [uncultured Draconibacterium sp.]